MSSTEEFVLTYPATILLSQRSLSHLADLLGAHRTRCGTRYRRLDPGQQALLDLAHLRNGDTPPHLAWPARNRRRCHRTVITPQGYVHSRHASRSENAARAKEGTVR